MVIERDTQAMADLVWRERAPPGARASPFFCAATAQKVCCAGGTHYGKNQRGSRENQEAALCVCVCWALDCARVSANIGQSSDRAIPTKKRIERGRRLWQPYLRL
ncbi:hypothetical protein TW95_gp1421 [Pandoravirus inopinatum]|uniref:Uncharacterized protein n=1 Tax=Pandoravirus inopinatum TaxID=1605721 RepID=A0A0B5J8D9_9VIRU|nr:hypothetical protein TW95_gp1421 [Pandoravirus inopinatum]AJF98155.1 hypothetical protein [Pandoravirus inopinatum]